MLKSLEKHAKLLSPDKSNHFREMGISKLPCSLCYDYISQKEFGHLLLSLSFGSYVLREFIFSLRQNYGHQYSGYQRSDIEVRELQSFARKHEEDILRYFRKGNKKSNRKAKSKKPQSFQIYDMQNSFSYVERLITQSEDKLKLQFKKDLEKQKRLDAKMINKQNDEIMSRKVQVVKLTNEVSALKSELKLQLQYAKRDQEALNETRTKMKDLEETLQTYEYTINQMNKEIEPVTEAPVKTVQECNICFEKYSQERKQVAFTPCGHSSCGECSKSRHLERKCPFCRTKIKRFVVLQGIY